MLAVPSCDMVKTLVLISWYEFGEDRDSVSLLIRMRADRPGTVDVSMPAIHTDVEIFGYGLAYGPRYRYVFDIEQRIILQVSTRQGVRSPCSAVAWLLWM
jgi:hypothetical protein